MEEEEFKREGTSEGKDFELWLKNKGQVSGLHFLWACHGLRSLVSTEDGNQSDNSFTAAARTGLIESVYRQWVISGELELSNHVLRSTIALLLPLCRPSSDNIEGHLRALRNIEGHVHSHIQSVLLPQFQNGNKLKSESDSESKGKVILRVKTESGVIINGEDGLCPTRTKRPPPPPVMRQAEFLKELISRLEALSSGNKNGEKVQ